MSEDPNTAKTSIPAAHASPDPNYQKFAIAPTRLPAPDQEVRPPSPIRRSGSPYRRKQIQQLEKLPEKRQKTVTFSDSERKAGLAQETATLHGMTRQVEALASSLETQATTTQAVQQEILHELRLLKTAVAHLQADVLTLLGQRK